MPVTSCPCLGPTATLSPVTQYICSRKEVFFTKGYGNFAPLRWAADYELWLRFSKITDCYIVPALTAAFRLRSSGQASFENRNAYSLEVAEAAQMHLREETLGRQFAFKVLRLMYCLPRLKQLLLFVEKYFR